jgi:hypothetical protein
MARVKKVFSFDFQHFSRRLRPAGPGALIREAKAQAGQPGRLARRAGAISLGLALLYLAALAISLTLAVAGLWVADGA